MQAINACGGVTVVQDPATASFPTMLEVAIANAKIDHCVGIDELAQLVQRLVAEEAPAPPRIPEALRFEARMSEDRSELVTSDQRCVAPTQLSCPECGGPLWQREPEGDSYRCLVGHAFHLNSLAVAHDNEVDRTLWAAIRLFEQRANIAQQMSDQTRQRGFERRADIHATRAQESKRHALRLRELQAMYRALPTDSNAKDEVQRAARGF